MLAFDEEVLFAVLQSEAAFCFDDDSVVQKQPVRSVFVERRGHGVLDAKGLVLDGRAKLFEIDADASFEAAAVAGRGAAEFTHGHASLNCG